MAQSNRLYHIGQILIHLGAVTHQQVIEARAQQMSFQSTEPLGEIMIGLGHITEDDLQRALSLQRDLFEH